MCFTITTPEKIAKKDIGCYKLLDFAPHSKCDYRSAWFSSPYKLGEVYKTKSFGFDEEDGIDKGRHSYSALSRARKVAWTGDCIVKCLIPKGTKYYYNSGDKEYVSLAIKLVKEL